MRRNGFVLSVLVVILITSVCVGCNNASNPRAYQLDYYMDTIQGHVIISAVCSRNDGNGICVSSIKIGSTGTVASKADNIIKTSFVWQDSRNKEFPVYMTNEGSCFVIRRSKSGENYRAYLGKEVSEQIQRELEMKEN